MGRKLASYAHSGHSHSGHSAHKNNWLFNGRLLGGYHDPNSLRAELGLSEAEMPDSYAWEIIANDMKELKKIESQSKSKILEEKRSLEARKAALENDLSIERNRRRLYEEALSPYFPNSAVNNYNPIIPMNLSNWSRQRLKDEVKRELLEEQEEARKWKSVERALKRPVKRSRSRSRVHSKPKSKSKPKKKSKHRK
jgi:hypothetical protein